MTIVCPCIITQVPGLRFPWSQHPCFNPAGNRLYFTDLNTSDVVVLKFPELTSVGTITRPGPADSGVGGLCADDLGRLYYVTQLNGFVGSTQVLDDAIYRYESGSWTQIWHNSYSGAEGGASNYTAVGINGCYYDSVADDVIYMHMVQATGGDAGTTTHTYVVGTSGTTYFDGGAVASNVSSSAIGYQHFVCHPDGGIWVATYNATTRRLRRYAPDWSTYVEVAFIPTTIASGSTICRAVPDYELAGGVIIHGRAVGGGSDDAWRISSAGTLVESATCTFPSAAHCGYTTALDRISSFAYQSTTSDAYAVDWTQRCAAEPAGGWTLGKVGWG